MGAVATVAGPLLSILSTGTRLQANEDEYAFKREENLRNQRLAAMAAADARQRGAQEAGKVRLEGSNLAARQKVGFAASGVDPTVGTAADVMADSRVMSELDALTVENNAAREAFGFAKEGEQLRRQASLARRRHQLRQFTTLLGGAGDFAGSLKGIYEED